jgi:pimeloyl-ACP methyl ester carboxylesterase
MPPRRRTSDAESSALALGRRGNLDTDGGRIATWTWGAGPAVLLAHGWGSRGARLRSFVEPLVASGRSVVAFDAPGHGASGGRTSSLPQFARAIRAVTDAAGGIEAAVAHSLGCASVAFAMTRGLSLTRAVFVAPAANPGAYTEKFARTLAIPAPVLERMKRRFEETYGLTWDELDVPRAARGFRAGLLVIHDRDDTEVPFQNGEAIAAAWPGATLVPTEGLGHTRIVHDSVVVARAVAFVTGSEAANRPL